MNKNKRISHSQLKEEIKMMTKAELNKWAEKISRMLNENCVEWGLSLDESERFSLGDITWLNENYGISSIIDDRGCLTFIKQ